MNVIRTPSHQVRKADNHHGCPTVAAVEADWYIHHEHYVHHHHDHTAETFHQHQAYHRPDLSRHSTLGNFKYSNGTLQTLS